MGARLLLHLRQPVQLHLLVEHLPDLRLDRADLVLFDFVEYL